MRRRLHEELGARKHGQQQHVVGEDRPPAEAVGIGAGEERAEEKAGERCSADEAEPEGRQRQLRRGEPKRDADDPEAEAVAEYAAKTGHGDAQVERTQRGVVIRMRLLRRTTALPP